MYDPSNGSVAFKNDNSNGTNLLPVLPTLIRDARYRGDARYAINVADQQRPHHSPFYQGQSHIDHYFTRSQLQLSVRLFSIALYEAVRTNSAQGHPIDPKDG